MYAIDWQSPGAFACTPVLLIARSEGRMTDWQSAPSLRLKTWLLQGRPFKCLNHHNQRLCKIFLAGVNLLFQTFGVLLQTILGCIFLLFSVWNIKEMKSKIKFWVLIVYTRYLYGIWFLVYNLEFMNICCNFNGDKTYPLFVVNSISPEIMVVQSFGHLEGLL